MITGTLFGIGVGPGDPELITVKGTRVLSNASCVVVPKSAQGRESVALRIAREHIPVSAEVVELLFPMTADKRELQEKWDAAAESILTLLAKPQDVAFLTLGDPLLYSTYIYLLRSLRAKNPDVRTTTVPGIMAMGAAAALTEFPLGEGKEPVTVVPTADDLKEVERALGRPGTVVLMKVGKRLQPILEILDRKGLLDAAVFVSRAGQEKESVVTDLRGLIGAEERTGYLSIILVHVAPDAACEEESV